MKREALVPSQSVVELLKNDHKKLEI